MKKSVRTAIIQKPPVFLNLKASVAKAVEYIKEASEKKARLIVFPETWLPGYPVWVDSAPEAALWNNPAAKSLYGCLFENSIKIESHEFNQLAKVAKDEDVYVVMGANEKVGNTLYNSILFFDGVNDTFKVHRKLVPTYTERLIWGRGDGSTISYVETDFGNLGGLICWEHWMPLARAAMHSFNETVHVALWPDINEKHQLASKHYAFEGRCFVVAAGMVISKEDVIKGFESVRKNDRQAHKLLDSIKPRNEDGLIYEGGSSVIAPDSTYTTGPSFDEAKILYSEFNLNYVSGELMYLDTNGHYSRPDIFTLTVNKKKQKNVRFE